MQLYYLQSPLFTPQASTVLSRSILTTHPLSLRFETNNQRVKQKFKQKVKQHTRMKRTVKLPLASASPSTKSVAPLGKSISPLKSSTARYFSTFGASAMRTIARRKMDRESACVLLDTQLLIVRCCATRFAFNSHYPPLLPPSPRLPLKIPSSLQLLLPPVGVGKPSH
jgi:hypothetical protein